jgi:hypothetical protein
MNKEIYQKLQDTFIEATGLKVGDTVKITREASDNELGWDNIWISDMTRAVGSTGKITHIEKVKGIKVSGGYNYPFFVLEKVPEAPKTVEVELNNTYTATVSATTLKVGCQNFDISVLDKLVEARDSLTSETPEKESRIGKVVPFKDVRIGEKAKYAPDGKVPSWENTTYTKTGERELTNPRGTKVPYHSLDTTYKIVE